MKYENVEFERNFQLKPTVRPTDEPTDSASNSISTQSQAEKSHNDIQVLVASYFGFVNKNSNRSILLLSLQIIKERLMRENQGKHIAWLQKILIEYCFAKLCATKNEIVPKNRDDVIVIEPVPHHCICKFGRD